MLLSVFEGVSLLSIFFGVSGRAEFNAMLAFGHKNSTYLYVPNKNEYKNTTSLSTDGIL